MFANGEAHLKAIIFFLCLTATFCGARTAEQDQAAASSYKYIRIGAADDAPARKLSGGFALIGGGKDLDEAFVWMCTRSRGGDFLIIRATGTDAYNPYVNSLCKQNSVATLIIPNHEAAEDPSVARIIRNAAAIFIAGGDQSNYINFWNGTPVQAALNDSIARGVPIGGTSAGLAVLGEFIYSAQNDLPNGPNLTSRDALANPFHNQITIATNFLRIPPLHGIITDSHFSSRDRLGRTLVFLARILQTGGANPARAIGVDEHTAVLVAPDGSADIAGTGSAYFFQAARLASQISPSLPLTIDAIEVTKATNGNKFDLTRWTGGGIRYQLYVENGTVRSTQAGGAIY